MTQPETRQAGSSSSNMPAPQAPPRGTPMPRPGEPGYNTMMAGRVNPNQPLTVTEPKNPHPAFHVPTPPSASALEQARRISQARAAGIPDRVMNPRGIPVAYKETNEMEIFSIAEIDNVTIKAIPMPGFHAYYFVVTAPQGVDTVLEKTPIAQTARREDANLLTAKPEAIYRGEDFSLYSVEMPGFAGYMMVTTTGSGVSANFIKKPIS